VVGNSLVLTLYACNEQQFALFSQIRFEVDTAVLHLSLLFEGIKHLNSTFLVRCSIRPGLVLLPFDPCPLCFNAVTPIVHYNIRIVGPTTMKV
jgi:hypothetical protein